MGDLLLRLATVNKESYSPLEYEGRKKDDSNISKQFNKAKIILMVLKNNNYVFILSLRLLQVFETLKVPPKKPKDLTNVSSLLKTERAQHRANEEGLALLQVWHLNSESTERGKEKRPKRFLNYHVFS